MIRFFVTISLLFFVTNFGLGQQLAVQGKVLDASTGETLDFASVVFVKSNVSVMTDESGKFNAVLKFLPDSIIITDFGYKELRAEVTEKNLKKEIQFSLIPDEDNIGEVVIVPQGDMPSIRILKKVIANKPDNDKKKLDAYNYQVYTKTQIDLDNLSQNFRDMGFVKKMDFILDYLDSSNNDKNKERLPILFSETMSDYYYKSKPPNQREIIHATHLSGIDNFSLGHIISDVNMDINFYNNYIELFQRAFVSPIAKLGRGFYHYQLLDSAYIDNQFCYLLSFKPKKTGGTTFEGTMWIHDSTFALKEISATLSSVANINFINGMNVQQQFVQLPNNIWMLQTEKLTLDMGLLRGKKLFNFFVQKTSVRNNFVINQPKPDKFYNSVKNEENELGSKEEKSQLWDSLRPIALNHQEKGVEEMTDSLKKAPLFNLMKGVIWTLTTGYYPVGYVEIGDVFNLIGFNPVEKFSGALALRTSNRFSKRVEIGGSVGYGFRNDKLKWYGRLRFNVTPKQRGILTLYTGTQLVQYGTSPSLGSLFSSILRMSPPDKLFYEDKLGFEFEKDLGKDFVLNFSGYSKQLTSVGLAKFQRSDSSILNKLNTTEFSFGVSWGKGRQYISGVFDRSMIGSRYPILYLKTKIGIGGILGSKYNYQNIEFGMDHIKSIGIVGRIQYGFSLGKYFGNTPYPFLKIHEGSETYWFLTDGFNTMKFFNFISDQYATAYVEHHFQGLLLNRIPLMKRLKWRLLIGTRITYGSLNTQRNSSLLIPSFVENFDRIPYAEMNVGIENIFKFFRVDFVYQLTHQMKGASPFGVRFRFDVNI